MTPGRSVYQPPPRPEIVDPVQAPTLADPAPPALDWGEYGARVAAWLLGAALLGWGAWHGAASWGWPAGDTAFGAAVGEILIGWRVGVLTAHFREERAHAAAHRAQVEALWQAQVATWQAAHAAIARTAGEWSHRYNGGVWPPVPADPPPAINVEERISRALLPLVARLDALAMPATSDGERARVVESAPEDSASIPEAPEATTRHLSDGRALLGAAYDNGPTRRLVAAAWRGEKITIRMMTGAGWMTDDAWRALTARLEGAGVLVRKGRSPTAGFDLAPAYKRPTEAATHAAIVDRLLAVGCGPGELPGDLEGT